jgi:hypothetical protein
VAHVVGRALTILVLVLLQACTSTGDDGDDAGHGGAQGGGAPINAGGGGAPGAPIDIPAITIAEGLPLEPVRAQLEKKLREACGGDLCLTIAVAETDGNHETCQYSGNTDPPAGTEVERGGTVTLVMGSLPCTDADGDGVSDDNDGDGLPDDTDGDGTPDVLDDDANGDGIPDVEQSTS